MSTVSGPNLITDSMMFSMDLANPKSINASGCVGYNNAPQLVKNLIRLQDVISTSTSLRLGNLTYFTAFAIDYPESSYGGSAASRQGITQGFNVTSGSKVYEASRALHLWVWDDDTSTWVSDSYFTGFRLAGHCYDTYEGSNAPGGYTGELDRFVTDFNKIKSSFKNATYIVAGSHRDSRRNSTVRDILYDLGMPHGTELDNDYVGAPEYVLVGKPGLGPGNGVWAYQNYSSNPDQVAHANFGLPLRGNIENNLYFDGSTDYIALPNTQIVGASAGTVSAIIKIPSAQNNYDCIFSCETGPDWNNLRTWVSMYDSNKIRFTVSNGSASTQNGCVSSVLSYNTIYHVTCTFDGTSLKIYLNGVVDASYSSSIVPGSFTPSLVRIGHHYDTRFFNGSIYYLSTYSKALSANEVLTNYNALQGRYGI